MYSWDRSDLNKAACRCDHSLSSSCVVCNGFCCLVLTATQDGRHCAVTCATCWSMLENQAEDRKYCLISRIPGAPHELASLLQSFWYVSECCCLRLSYRVQNGIVLLSMCSLKQFLTSVLSLQDLWLLLFQFLLVLARLA